MDESDGVEKVIIYSNLEAGYTVNWEVVKVEFYREQFIPRLQQWIRYRMKSAPHGFIMYISPKNRLKLKHPTHINSDFWLERIGALDLKTHLVFINRESVDSDISSTIYELYIGVLNLDAISNSRL